MTCRCCPCCKCDGQTGGPKRNTAVTPPQKNVEQLSWQFLFCSGLTSLASGALVTTGALQLAPTGAPQRVTTGAPAPTRATTGARPPPPTPRAGGSKICRLPSWPKQYSTPPRHHRLCQTLKITPPPTPRSSSQNGKTFWFCLLLILLEGGEEGRTFSLCVCVRVLDGRLYRMFHFID